MGFEKLIFRFGILLFLRLVRVSSSIDYRDFHVFQINVRNQNDMKILQRLHRAAPTDHFWASPPRDRDAFALLTAIYPKNDAKNFHDSLKKEKLQHEIVTRDLQEKFDEADMEPVSTADRWKRSHAGCACCNATIHGDFMRYDDVVSWMKFLVTCKSSDKSLGVKTFRFGNTYEGRPLMGIEIGADADEHKASIWLHANEHAREWIAGSTAIYIIDKLVNDPSLREMATKIHWYIVPIENPDGFEFTRTDRMWRKNRNPTYGAKTNRTCTEEDCKEKKCVGVDLNRNWGSHWNDKVDSSDNPCDYQIFGGPSAFSEAESKGPRDFILPIIKNFKAFFSLHSYGQLWLVPWSFTKDHVEDYKDLMEIGGKGAKAIEAVHNTSWRVGPSPEILYAVSGSGMDWAKLQGIKYSFTLELRPKDETRGQGLAFVPSKSAIIPSGEEVLAGVKVVADRVIQTESHAEGRRKQELIKRQNAETESNSAARAEGGDDMARANGKHSGLRMDADNGEPKTKEQQHDPSPQVNNE